MKYLFSIMSMLIGASAFASSAIPTSPDPGLTPGSLCTHPSEWRYPEEIPYCIRNVNRTTKQQVFHQYDQRLGYELEKMNRGDFKIDHYIPLCMGGSNEMNNLWPQHKSVYDVTDPVEPLACQKMAEGKLKQSEAVELMKRAKLDLREVPRVIHYLNQLE